MRHVLTIKNLLAAAAVATAVGAGSGLSAQGSDDVTVMLRSGERVSGRLEDLVRG